MSQNLNGISFDNPAYTVIFIIVAHNGQMFSFINKTQERLEFFWNRWGKWKDKLEPYSVHAFLIKTYNTKGGSGQGFCPEVHLCEFVNIKEARAFNSAYLTKYNKIYHDANAEQATEFACEFAMRLMDVQEEREEWLEVAERAAQRAFAKEIWADFFGEYPEPLPHVEFDLQNIVDAGPVAEMMKAWVEENGEECPVYPTRST